MGEVTGDKLVTDETAKLPDSWIRTIQRGTAYYRRQIEGEKLLGQFIAFRSRFLTVTIYKSDGSRAFIAFSRDEGDYVRAGGNIARVGDTETKSYSPVEDMAFQGYEEEPTTFPLRISMEQVDNFRRQADAGENVALSVLFETVEEQNP